jgi:hypothetical protein
MAPDSNTVTASPLGPEVIAAIRENRTIADAKLEALRQFVGKVTRERGAVSETDVTTFKAAGYDNRAVLDLLVLAATKLISNYTNHLAQTPNDRFMKGRGMDGARQAQAGRLSRTRGPYPCDRNGDRTRAKCLFRQLPHRFEARGDHGRRGDDGHSSG